MVVSIVCAVLAGCGPSKVEKAKAYQLAAELKDEIVRIENDAERAKNFRRYAEIKEIADRQVTVIRRAVQGLDLEELARVKLLLANDKVILKELYDAQAEFIARKMSKDSLSQVEKMVHAKRLAAFK